MELKCKRCGLIWNSRKDIVKACPKCKSYHWNEDKDATPQFIDIPIPPATA